MRVVVKDELARRTRSIAEEAYYYSMGVDRGWARRYLFNVVLGNPTSVSAAAYLVAACTPRALTSRFGRLLRRVAGLDGTP